MAMLETHGYGGLHGTLLVAVRCGQRRLVEVDREIPELQFAAAAPAVRRFAAALEDDREKSWSVARLRAKIFMDGTDLMPPW